MIDVLRAIKISHFLLEQFLVSGQTVVDATAGNGNDTLFLSKIVGTSGLVYAFDLQENALKETSELLKKNNCLNQVKIIHDGHENMDKHVNNPVQAIVYNLGYLPGGNKNIITKKETTLFSIQKGINLLSLGGVISIIVYPGHPGGLEEAICVQSYLKSLSYKIWDVMKWNTENEVYNKSPYLFFLHKKK
ncbi:MAG: class I SAM-dependent methyltransferase [Clostridia bacterium]|nr:class I SAM-dependent methyltransferase [Clostridia bacterium]MDD4049374.1 class I SAM-dependent methyltransferase [Clostridia bacterium]